VNEATVAKMLAEYETPTDVPIRPDRLPRDVDGSQARGYRLEQFADAWERYLPPETGEGL
jgi:hypothetical protein